MADISKEVQDFKTAIYGEDVRDSMVSLAEKINNEVTRYGQAESSRAAAEEARELAETQRQKHTEEAINGCDTAADRANEAAEKAEGVVTGDISAFNVTFQQAAKRENIISGESIKTVFGKAAKWFADLKTGAFATVVNNLTTTAANTVLDGRQGKALDEKITELKEALKNVLNLNSKQLTNSSYYPTSYMYRSGQNIYLRCSGVTTKEVPQGTELVVATEGTVPESFRPDIDLIFYAVVSAGGAIVRVSVSASGKVTFTAQEKLVEGFGVNLHVNYITGKNPL